MSYFGGMISFEIKDDSDAETRRVLSSKIVFARRESWRRGKPYQSPGEYDTCIYSKSRKNKERFKDSLIRLSVGIEDAEDLIADLEQTIG